VTFGAVLGLFLSLGIVLGLFGFAMRALRRFTTVRGDAGALQIQVVRRVALSPRQGLAVVRLGDRAMVVSVGDGGVRHITELTPAESATLGIERTIVAAQAEPRVASRIFGTFGLIRTLLVALLPLALMSAQLSAQTPAGQPAASPTASVATQAVARAAGAALGAQQQQPAPRLNVQLGNGTDSDLRINGTVGTVMFLGLMAMLPTLLLLMTSFTRILIVLHFLKQALGTQTAPPAHLLAALSLILTGFIMAPTLDLVNANAIKPWLAGEIDEGQMLKVGIEPFRAFMLEQLPEDHLANFVEMSGQELPETPEEVSLSVLITAFATSELRAAFQMGFALFLPFVIIDLVVSAVLTSMGMFMLPPTMVALPCKLLLFVLVDGWSLIVGSLVASFA
jgi:flagellar biosynthetic protein FliP